MGIRVNCPKCAKQLNVKSFLAGKRGVCPECHTKFEIPAGSEHNVILEVEESEQTAAIRVSDLTKAIRMPVAATPAPTAAQVPSWQAPPTMAAAAYPQPGVPSLPMPNPVVLATAPIDAVAQAPQATWHIFLSGGETYGPVQGEVLRQWLFERRILADSLLWREGWADWQRADAVFPELSPTAAPAMPPLMATPLAPAMVAVPGVFPMPESPAAVGIFPSEAPRAAPTRAYGRRDKSTRTIMLTLLILAILILAPLLGYVLVRQF